MKFLRTTSTRRLLAALAGLVVAALAGTAIAIAATGSGPVPARTSLARAVHKALAAPQVRGVTARITLTNHLIDSADTQGTDPMLSGGSGRLWASPRHGLRMEIQSTNGDMQVVMTNQSFWAYDAASDTVYKGSLPAHTGPKRDDNASGHAGLPTVAQIQSAIQRITGQATLSTARPTDVAGRPAYSVRISPKASGGLFGGAELAWDAARGIPLRFGLYARGDSTPVLELAATNISYGAVSASVFSMKPPRGAHVVNVDLPAPGPDKTAKAKAGAKSKPGAEAKKSAITGAGPVAAHLSFPLDAPATAGGLNRSDVRLLGRGTRAGALVTYGQGLGSVAVLEHKATAGKSPNLSSSGDNQPGLSLPTVSVAHGASAQELGTALGTVLTFTRSGVNYTVIGSVTPATARAVADAL